MRSIGLSYRITTSSHGDLYRCFCGASRSSVAKWNTRAKLFPPAICNSITAYSFDSRLINAQSATFGISKWTQWSRSRCVSRSGVSRDGNGVMTIGRSSGKAYISQRAVACMISPPLLLGQLYLQQRGFGIRTFCPDHIFGICRISNAGQNSDNGHGYHQFY